MSKIISVIGNIGVGKTTLTNVISLHLGYKNMTEQHSSRPFQAKFAKGEGVGLANQIDYLLLRAEQEIEIRTSHQKGIFDGGLDLDFHVFTKLFANRNLLSKEEYNLCERLYIFLRKTLPEPDLTIYLVADSTVVKNRFQNRERINIARLEDMRQINVLLEKYFSTISVKKQIQFDVSKSSPDFPEIIQIIKEMIDTI